MSCAFAAGLVLLMASASVTGRAEEPPRVFKSGIDLVTVDAVVRDSAGRLVETLSPEDFLVFENGQRQTLTFMEASGRVPLRLVLLIDRSASMSGPKLQRALEAARQLGDRLRPEDSLEIVAFNQRTTRLSLFGAERTGVDASLSSLTSDGLTALYDALLVAAGDLERYRPEDPSEARDVIVVLSDGEDTGSISGFDEVLPALRRSGALVYALSLRANDHGGWQAATWPMLQLARDTGGRTVTVPSVDALAALYEDITTEIRHMYRLAYVSTDATRTGDWRSITVRTRNPSLTVRARSGYYAPRAAVPSQRSEP